jgi:hypothetical protein
LLVVVAAAVLLTVLVGSSAALPSGGCVFTAATGETVCTFSYTGAAELWEVPFGVTSATFDVDGAAGSAGSAGPTFGAGGLGGRASATIAVTPGQVLQINVGGAGALPGGGFNGGATAGIGVATASGGGGGGASDVRNGAYALADRLIVGGGGGGGGNSLGAPGPPDGGVGGGLVGGDGLGTGAFPFPGHGGTQTQGGTSGGGASVNGSLGAGGAGSCDGPIQCGGGGGGGLYGGGGSGGSGGGGGGSGYGPAGVVFQSGVRSGNGQVTVTYGSVTDQMFNLLEEVDGLTPKSTRAKLAKTLNKLIGHVFENETNHACKDLATFIKQVHAAKKLSHDERASLTAQAHIIEATLGC